MAALPAIIPVVAGIASIASAGVGIASAAGAFTPKVPQPAVPGRDSAEVERRRKAALKARRDQKGPRSSILTSPVNIEEPNVARATLLG
jgi:hypothetical protein